MGTLEFFNDMLNEYLPYELLKGEYLKRDWLMNRISKDLKWVGGDIIVPFKASQASSVKFGGLTSASDISRYKYARGKITTQPEAWASLIFDHKDLTKHGKISEQNFLKILPDQLEEMMNYFKMIMSVSLLNGPYFANATSTADRATGEIIVDKIDLFELDQKITISKGSTQVSVYVTSILIESSQITLSLTRGGAAADLTTYDTGVKFSYDGVMEGGVLTNNFTSIPSILLSAVNGGDANYLGFAKTAYPYLQCINQSGSSITASNIIEKLFDFYVGVKTKARGNAKEFVMSFKHLGSAMKVLENEKAAFKVKPDQTKVSKYGWTEITVMSLAGQGEITLVGVQEMPNDKILALDMDAFKFHTNGLFQKRVSPDGIQYYEVRNTDGYQYIVDISICGQIACRAPDWNGVIHSIPNY